MRYFYLSMALYSRENPQLCQLRLCPRYFTSQTPPVKPIMHHSPSCQTSRPLFFNHSFIVSIHLFRGQTTMKFLTHSPTYNFLAILFHILSIRPNLCLFIHSFHYSIQLSYLFIGTLSICTAVILDLSFSLHSIALQSHRTTTTSNN